MKILLIAPFFDQTIAGESWSTYKWVEGICRHHEVTVLTTHKKTWDPTQSPIQAHEVVNWTDPEIPTVFARLNRELKPTYFLFYVRARSWLKKTLKTGRTFDLIHQINPLALRYPCPAQSLGQKYIMGPLAGSLTNQPGFNSGETDKQWYRKLRKLDSFRIRYDPALRRSYSGAELLLGVAPYVESIVAAARPKRFEIEGETGVDTISTKPISAPPPGSPLRLLYVGRIIRTKGVIDAVRAVAIARKTSNIRFDIVGAGDMLEACKAEAAKLELDDIVSFHGRIPRDQVDHWYRQAHVFLFPSFREPSGNVVFEAMGHGLPVIAANAGGPGYVVNTECGYIVEPESEINYPQNLASAITAIDSNRSQITTLSKNATCRMEKLALWDNKIQRLLKLYETLQQIKHFSETTKRF